MHTPDLINGLFETSGGLSVWNNVRQLLKDKKVAGVSLVSAALFNSWGFWNLYYYPSLDQWASFTGGLIIVSGNTVWLGLAYLWRNK